MCGDAEVGLAGACVHVRRCMHAQRWCTVGLRGEMTRQEDLEGGENVKRAPRGGGQATGTRKIVI
jgi:hypothetical protein